jgi:hypothetical protein
LPFPSDAGEQGNTTQPIASVNMRLGSRSLRPLLWFGLLEHRHDAPLSNQYGGRHFFRKSVLFDRFVQFDVETERASSTLN